MIILIREEEQDFVEILLHLLMSPAKMKELLSSKRLESWIGLGGLEGVGGECGWIK